MSAHSLSCVSLLLLTSIDIEVFQSWRSIHQKEGRRDWRREREDTRERASTHTALLTIEDSLAEAEKRRPPVGFGKGEECEDSGGSPL